MDRPAIPDHIKKRWGKDGKDYSPTTKPEDVPEKDRAQTIDKIVAGIKAFQATKKKGSLPKMKKKINEGLMNKVKKAAKGLKRKVQGWGDTDLKGQKTSPSSINKNLDDWDKDGLKKLANQKDGPGKRGHTKDSSPGGVQAYLARRKLRAMKEELDKSIEAQHQRMQISREFAKADKIIAKKRKMKVKKAK